MNQPIRREVLSDCSKLLMCSVRDDLHTLTPFGFHSLKSVKTVTFAYIVVCDGETLWVLRIATLWMKFKPVMKNNLVTSFRNVRY